MMLRVRYSLVFGLVVLLQLQVGCLCGKRSDNDHALTLQTKVENLIEKILGVIQDYYQQIRTELKCIPDEVPDIVMGTLKSAIDCVDYNEREYDGGRITSSTHKKSFLKCFSEAKSAVEKTMSSINPNIDYCPQNMTEKTYQINLTTTFTKTFHINIKNGLEITKKKVNLGNGKHVCVFNPEEDVADQGNQIEVNDESNEHEGKDPSKEHDGKGPSKEYDGKGPSKEYDGKGPSKEHYGKGPSKEYYGKGPASEEYGVLDYISDEDDGKIPVPEEYGGMDQEPMEDDGKDSVSKEHKGMGHESKEYIGINPGSAEDVPFKEVTQIEENNDSDNVDNDEDRQLILLGKPNINSSNDHAEPEKKVNPKNTFSNLEPILEDDGNDYSGMDEDKFFFPETTAKPKFTTQLESNLGAAKPPSEKTSDEDYFTDPDTEEEDYNFGSEYYYAPDKEKNHNESSEETLARIESRYDQGIPTAEGKQRIQIRPRNQTKQKQKKQQQFSGRRNIKLPETVPKKLRSKQAPQNPTPSSLSQSFLQSDF